MRPLTSQDPRAIGAYRPLARLGAGGMGVVYLARGPGGDLAAVKVIHAEHAADPGFRARFRREAEAARSLDGPWAVPVAGADTEAHEPWLATEFVPGRRSRRPWGSGDRCRRTPCALSAPGWPGRSPTPTRRTSSTATSNPATCSSPETGPGSSTSASHATRAPPR
ncbi:hypothetical protein GA0115235_115526 [Streptomyces sp. DpondAA-F4a]|nr:hypothetical protein GA0115235_115526 [Streptomyces sp. DpondAA-F4a]